MSRTSTIEIKKDKLHEAFIKSGCKTFASMSGAMGRNQTFISKYLGSRSDTRSVMGYSDVYLIYTKWGIDVSSDALFSKGEASNPAPNKYYHKCNRVLVDLDKLNNLIKMNGLTPSDFGRSIGRSPNFLYNTKSSGTIGLSDYELIKLKYGVDIMRDPTSEEEVVEPIMEDNMEDEPAPIKLTNAGVAVKDAFDKDELMKELKDAVYFGIKDGLIEIFRALKNDL